MTIEETIEMTREMIIEMKIIETRDIKKYIKTIIMTHMTKAVIKLAMETRLGTKINTKAKTDIEMTAMTNLEVGLKNRDIRENIKIIIKTHMARVITELAMETMVGAKIDTKAKTDTEMTAMTKLEVGPKKKKSAHIMIEKLIVLRQNLKECTKFCKQ